MTPRGWALFAACRLSGGSPTSSSRWPWTPGFPPAFLAWLRVLLAALILLRSPGGTACCGAAGPRGWPLAVHRVRDRDPFPADRRRRAARLLLARRDPDRGHAALGRPCSPCASPVRAAHRHPPGRPLSGCRGGRAVGIDVAGNSDELLGAAHILVATLGYASGPMILKRYGTSPTSIRSAPSPAALGHRLGHAAPARRSAACRRRLPRATRSRRCVVLGLICTALGLPALLPPDRRDRARAGRRSSPTSTRWSRSRSAWRSSASSVERRRGGGAAADPGRVVAGDRRAAATRPGGGGDARAACAVVPVQPLGQPGAVRTSCAPSAAAAAPAAARARPPAAPRAASLRCPSGGSSDLDFATLPWSQVDRVGTSPIASISSSIGPVLGEDLRAEAAARPRLAGALGEPAEQRRGRRPGPARSRRPPIGRLGRSPVLGERTKRATPMRVPGLARRGRPAPRGRGGRRSVR